MQVFSSIQFNSVQMDDAFATMEQNRLRNGSGNFAILSAIPLVADQFCRRFLSFISAIDSRFLL
jgi:hypothetical protein